MLEKSHLSNLLLGMFDITHTSVWCTKEFIDSLPLARERVLSLCCVSVSLVSIRGWRAEYRAARLWDSVCQCGRTGKKQFHTHWTFSWCVLIEKFLWPTQNGSCSWSSQVTASNQTWQCDLVLERIMGRLHTMPDGKPHSKYFNRWEKWDFYSHKKVLERSGRVSLMQ